MKKMTPAQFERTAKDKKMDKAGAKKAGVSIKTWERSAADKKADAKALKQMNVKRKGK